jgi:hypothetical protein
MKISIIKMAALSAAKSSAKIVMAMAIMASAYIYMKWLAAVMAWLM